MRIIKGTFRLSIVIAVLAGIYAFVTAHMQAMEADQRNYELWLVLRCGEKFLNRDMSAYTNEFGNIDIGKAGCANRQFFARFDEIKEALAQARPKSIYRDYVSATPIIVQMIFAFFVVNLLGLLVWISVRVFKWVRNGFA